MRIHRREFIRLSGSAIAATQIPAAWAAAPDKAWNAQWIWYPGQLASYRHSRRIRLAMERCSNVGYPGNFRQPVTEVYFLKTGTAGRDTLLRWAAPISRVRTMIGGLFIPGFCFGEPSIRRRIRGPRRNTAINK